MEKNETVFAALATIIAFGLFGCGSTSRLEPAKSEAKENTPFEQSALSKVGGVEVKTVAGEWPGSEEIREDVTPLKVTIENNSSKKIKIQYEEFALIGPTGTVFAALPPYEVEGTVEKPVVTRDYEPIPEPIWGYSHFQVAPYYSTIYPTIPPYEGVYYYDPGYYVGYDRYWVETELPTEEMLVHALPEGSLLENGDISGFLYFERIPPTLNWVRFRMDLVDVEEGKQIGEISIPFEVEDYNEL